MKNGVYISYEACTPVFRKNGEYPMSDVYSERLFSRETRVSAWFSNSFAGAGVQFPASIVLWPAFVERAVLKPGEGFKHKNYTRFAIEMPLEGRIVCEARGKTYSAVPGEVALIHCGEDSAFQCAPEGNCRKISIGISGPLVHSLTTELHLVDPLTVKLGDSEAFLNLLLEIERKLGVREGVDYIGLSTLAFRLLSELAGMIERRYPPLLERALSIMKANISQRLTIAEIAEKLETSRSTLEHLFQESLSVSPHRYFSRLKLDTAKSLLLHTDLPVHQIAENVGALNSMQFCRSFKTECGVSPSEFRRKEK